MVWLAAWKQENVLKLHRFDWWRELEWKSLIMMRINEMLQMFCDSFLTMKDKANSLGENCLHLRFLSNTSHHIRWSSLIKNWGEGSFGSRPWTIHSSQVYKVWDQTLRIKNRAPWKISYTFGIFLYAKDYHGISLRTVSFHAFRIQPHQKLLIWISSIASIALMIIRAIKSQSSYCGFHDYHPLLDYQYKICRSYLLAFEDVFDSTIIHTAYQKRMNSRDQGFMQIK